MEIKTDEQYLEEIRAWDWDKIKALALTNYDDESDYFDQHDGERVGSCLLGTVFDLAPSGKYSMPWTSNQTDEDVSEDEKFYDALDKVAEEQGMFIESGEGDPCDIFASIVIEVKEDTEI